ncbi:MAG: MGMT family protein [Caldisericia bacterium]|nr:MGMT family protein [Caldisericia bacterium]
MTYKRKSWNEKLHENKKFPKIIYFEERFPCSKALKKLGAKQGDSVVLAPAIDVYEIMKKVPEGKLITLNRICEILANKYNTKYCCTLTTGIFVVVSANASIETQDYLPFWRTIKNDGSLNEKFLIGIDKQIELLKQEGHEIIKRGKKYFIKNFGIKINMINMI